jgi:hypothetical protein
LSCAIAVLCAGPAAAEPASGPRQDVDFSLTTTQPNAPTGSSFTGSYHAAGEPQGNPPYLRRMVFSYAPGLRFDTSVPDQCTASDAELSLRGPAACPPGAILGDGQVEGIFWAPITHAFVFDHYTHHVDVINNANEQIVLVESEGWTVQRGKFQPDGSLVFDTTTCFPAPPSGECADDYIMQLKTASAVPEYTNASGSYATTPPTCPVEGYWATTISYYWTDGSTDDVVTRQACTG